MSPYFHSHVKGDGMLGLYASAVLRDYGYDTVYCTGTRVRRSEFIERFGAIPLYNGKSCLLAQRRL